MANDVALQGLAAIQRRGYELVLTLETGVGSALYLNGLLVPQFSVSRYEARVLIGHSFVYIGVAAVSMALAVFGGNYASAYSGMA